MCVESHYISPDRLAMMMLGGSSINGGAANIGRQDFGDQERNWRDLSRSHTSKVTGAISSTVVTLSNIAGRDRRNEHQQHHHAKR